MESSVQSSWWMVLPLALTPAINSGHTDTASSTSAAIATTLLYLAVLACLAWAAASVLYWAHPGGPAWGRYWRGRGQTARACPNPIPGPRGLPVVGSIGLMSGLAHCSLAAEAARLPPAAKRLMALSLGPVRAVVTSSPDVAKEILESPAFAARPLNHAAYGLMFHRSIGFAEHGPYWRALRRIAAGHLLGARQVEAFAPYRARVAEDVVSALRGAGAGVVQVRGLLRRASLYYMMRFVFGKEYDVSRPAPESGKEVEELLEMVHEGYDLLGTENWCDYFPGLAAIDPQGVGARCAKLMPRVNRFVHGIIQDRRAKAIAGGEAPRDFVDILISLQESEGLTDDDIAAVLWETIFRGTDAMAVMMEWTLARLVLHRDVQAKAQRELDEVVGRNNRVTDSAAPPSLPYLQALLKESLRVHPPGPLLSWRHRAIYDTYVDGHLVPAGTTAMVNQWAISRDPDIWEAPLEFRPERFLPGGDGQDVSVLGAAADGRLVPFGSGRRSCPGKSLAMTTVASWMATLLHEFEWMPAAASSGAGAVDLSEVLRLSCEMAVPLEVRVRPRRATN